MTPTRVAIVEGSRGPHVEAMSLQQSSTMTPFRMNGRWPTWAAVRVEEGVIPRGPSSCLVGFSERKEAKIRSRLYKVRAACDVSASGISRRGRAIF